MDVAPLFGLRLRTPRLELRFPTHDELVELRELARTGVHPPELAFRGLEAEIARSGAIDGNVASSRVSEKLGYRTVGRSTVAPQGVEVGHTDFELRREEWRPPIPVELEGLEPCLPLFGLSSAAARP